MVPDVEGPMTQRHPDACQVLFDAAQKAGARCVRGVEDVIVATSGKFQRVTFKVGGSVRELRCRLVVADVYPPAEPFYRARGWAAS